MRMRLIVGLRPVLAGFCAATILCMCTCTCSRSSLVNVKLLAVNCSVTMGLLSRLRMLVLFSAFRRSVLVKPQILQSCKYARVHRSLYSVRALVYIYMYLYACVCRCLCVYVCACMVVGRMYSTLYRCLYPY